MRDVLQNSMREIIPTVVPQKADDVAVALLRYPFADTLHIDFADGSLAPNRTWLPDAKNDLAATPVYYEAHLMVAEPLSLGLVCARAGVRRLIAHVESFPHIDRAVEVFALWRAAGVEEIGCALNLLTPTTVCDSYAPPVDFFQLMTIARIGEQGQIFDGRSLSRVSEVHTRHSDMPLAVDGGVTLENIAALARAGATRFCVGSMLARAGDPSSTYEELLKAAHAIS